MKRWIFNITAALSLLLLLATKRIMQINDFTLFVAFVLWAVASWFHHVFICVLFAILPIIWFINWLKTRRRLAMLGKCRACGYDLTGNTTGECPECGVVVKTEAAQA